MKNVLRRSWLRYWLPPLLWATLIFAGNVMLVFAVGEP